MTISRDRLEMMAGRGGRIDGVATSGCVECGANNTNLEFFHIDGLRFSFLFALLQKICLSILLAIPTKVGRGDLGGHVHIVVIWVVGNNYFLINLINSGEKFDRKEAF